MALSIPRSDYGFYLNFTVQDSAGTAFNLTGYTITFKYFKSTSPESPIITGACSIVSGPSGTCQYLVALNDFAISGFYKAKIELAKTGVIESTGSFDIEVKE